ncbi:helix-turn-helix transcriptional regulator [Streptomyces sp. SID12488]|uniref:helix-turn-helix transcriptional regulator n=1 Tax=Streptomyces sp. SID12488 TaxID=2706040 RepID=UPI0013DB46AF|nr:helix-turn-helix transcriptional regulator [Streptomyces sp. SID12488]NEA68046.1 helix-turn-helix transcriptional regulator [Streptomyces sp. SID12488]
MDPQELANLAHLRRARDLIDREYARPLDVPTMAKHALMSPAHFSRRFRAAYGETPYSYLMTRRIERAMTLLRAGMSVTDACMTVGCTSLGSFSSRFTEIVGEPPSTYRGREHDAVTAMPACVAKVTTRPSRNGPGPDASSTGVSSTDAPTTDAPTTGTPATSAPAGDIGNVPSRIREAGRTAAA